MNYILTKNRVSYRKSAKLLITDMREKNFVANETLKCPSERTVKQE